MRLLWFTTTLLLLATVLAVEETADMPVVIIEAKEVNGQAVAEDRSDRYLDDMHHPGDQMAVESVDRSQNIYAPPPMNLLHGPIPVPVSLAAKPGSVVFPQLPQQQGPQHRRPQGYGQGPQQHRRQFPRRPPPPVQKLPPHPTLGHLQGQHLQGQHLQGQHLQGQRLQGQHLQGQHLQGQQLQGQHSQQQATFFPPPPLPTSFSPPPLNFNVPQASPRQNFPPNLGSEPQYSVPPPPPPQASKQPGPKEGPQLDVNFGDPKNNDLLEKSESSVSQIYSGPPPPPHPPSESYEGPSKQLAIGQIHVPQSSGESRQPIVHVADTSVSGSDSSNSYVPPSAVEPWPSTAPEMPQIVALDVKCEKNLMKVRIEFDKPFNGIIFSKGHYSNVHCVHLPAGLGRTHSTFDVSINSCGTTGNTENGLYGYGSQSGSGTYFENTIVIQYDPQVQEVWDQARKLRCTWHDQYEKSVTFRPFSVDMLDVVRADFAGDNVGCWMQIQVGKGPWASEVSGLVKIGQTMTMVLAIKDDDNKFDMMVRNCMAHDGKRAPIQLVDQRGCITRPKLMSSFTKIKDFGASASVLSYAHFQAFKFPDSMEVHFQCTIQICRYQCPEQCSEGLSQGYSGGGGSSPRDHRKKREVGDTTSDPEAKVDDQTDIGVNRVIQVVSTRDLTFVFDKNGTETEEMKEVTKETLVSSEFDGHDGLICMSTPGFAAILVVLLGILIVSCLLSAFLCLRFRSNPRSKSIISSYRNPAFMPKQECFEYQ